MWLQTASEFTTHVRMFGQHTMRSRDVKYRTAARDDAADSERETADERENPFPGERTRIVSRPDVRP
jgi:hypothetical protein